MTKIGFLLRFTLLYTLILLALTGAFTQFDIEGPVFIDSIILVLVALWCFESYSTKNRRLLFGEEKWHLILFALLGDAIASTLLGAPAFIAADISLSIFVFSMVFSLVLHGLILIFTASAANKRVIKQLPELAESS
ncbi:ABZJ_00895 family protein [Marinomonas gallaica]|uniref:ABZJ_00895 family protein n=1 Tax=Marinomonas gallaica TaxID=1806667 RepID=UPI003A93C542